MHLLWHAGASKSFTAIHKPCAEFGSISFLYLVQSTWGHRWETSSTNHSYNHDDMSVFWGRWPVTCRFCLQEHPSRVLSGQSCSQSCVVRKDTGGHASNDLFTKCDHWLKKVNLLFSLIPRLFIHNIIWGRLHPSRNGEYIHLTNEQSNRKMCCLEFFL